MKKWNVWMPVMADVDWSGRILRKQSSLRLVTDGGRNEEGRLMTRLDKKSDPVIVIEANTKSEARAVFKKLAGLRKKEKLRPGLRFREIKCQ